MNEEDRKLQKHLVDEMMKVSKTNPDVMFYMEALMKKYEELEQKVEQLENDLKEANESITWWSNRFKAVERDNRQLKNIRKEAVKCINDYAIENEDYSKIYNDEEKDLLNILNKGSD